MSGRIELVVGVCTKDCASTIRGVLEAVDQGLARFFTGRRALIVVSDGFSSDGTREVAAGVPTRAELAVLPQRGGPGKGMGVRTILEEAASRRAQAIALVDGDLTSIRPEWMELLLSPVLAGASLVVPIYLRHPHDGVITNHLAYPVVNALLGLGVRQPIGGEFALSGKLAEALLASPVFPSRFGIDIFITVTGAVLGGGVVQAALGVKEHESTKRYADPEALLVPMFHQVAGTLFRLLHHFRDHVKKVKGVRDVPQVGELPPVEPAPVPVDEGRLLARFRRLVGERIEGKNTFLGPLAEEVVGLSGLPLDGFRFPVPLWAEAVYRAICAFPSSCDVLGVLEPLWQGRYLAFVRQTKGLPVAEAEQVIRDQLADFSRLRGIVEGCL
ncbi:MAG: Glycosyl transferase family 2 [Acetothermia bacterium 64_32]|nr:MAG: Glycosyl transferase family 2 [Acetothermia bacterium 64_32]MBC7097856.1 hypothetical protein [Candidatus Bipolaricaulota bacterium]HAF69905.1 hypothetical protein [Candidatus Acetothermia bacterium]